MSRGAARGDWPRSAPEPDGAGAGAGDLSHITHGDTATSSGGPQPGHRHSRGNRDESDGSKALPGCHPSAQFIEKWGKF